MYLGLYIQYSKLWNIGTFQQKLISFLLLFHNQTRYEKIDYQLRRSSFSKLNDDPSNDFEINVIM